MPRTARLSVPGGVFHVVSRFARDERWLARAGARSAYLERLGHAASVTDTQVLAYCLMSNHVHLVLVQGEMPLERFTKSVHTGFAQWVQRRARGNKARGPVYAGRPRSVLVQEETYLLELVRYVHNNPVRAGLVRYARNSAWSSHRAYVGRAEAPDWLRVGYVLRRFGKNAARAADAFDRFVDEGRREPRRPELSGVTGAKEAAVVRRALGDGHRLSDGVLGTGRFVDRVLSDTERVEAALSSRGTGPRTGKPGQPDVGAVIDACLEVVGTDANELQARPRSRGSGRAKRLATWVWVHQYQGAQTEVARVLGLDTSVVSRYYGQALAGAGEHDELARQVTTRLAKRSKKLGRKERGAKHGRRPVRYFVDVVER